MATKGDKNKDVVGTGKKQTRLLSMFSRQTSQKSNAQHLQLVQVANSSSSIEGKDHMPVCSSQLVRQRVEVCAPLQNT